ncbi:putative maltokinase [Orrella sp. JC864]|uniref:putative maltokinase n=1 Tax=Orrella sp. JC864 TaxID=3120298 RepID=UPI00300832B0
MKTPATATHDLTLHLREGPRGGELVFTPSSQALLRDEVLPRYLARQRWFPQDVPARPARLLHAAALPGAPAGREYYLAELDAAHGGPPLRTLLGLAVCWDREPAQALARVALSGAAGWLADASAEPGFVAALLALMRQGGQVPMGQAVLRGVPEPALAEAMPADAAQALRWIDGEQSNTSVIVGQAAVFKLIRRVAHGRSPEAEMTRHLTRLGYAHAPALLGELQREDRDGAHTLAVLHAYVPNRGDAWRWSLQTLERALSESGASPRAGGELARMAALMGRRLGQLHALLSRRHDDPAFAPERVAASHAALRAGQVGRMLERALAALQARSHELDQPARACALWLAAHRERLLPCIESLSQAEVGTLRIRVHGDLHLGQVLVGQDDVYLIDFEGEPVSSLAERRARHTPYKDVAGMLRSFEYAAATLARRAPRAEVLAEFRSQARRRFLAAYHEAVGEQPGMGPSQRQALLQLAELEKAAYEVVYESTHRPDWLPIPLEGLAEIARAMLVSAAIDDEEHGS